MRRTSRRSRGRSDAVGWAQSPAHRRPAGKIAGTPFPTRSTLPAILPTPQSRTGQRAERGRGSLGQGHDLQVEGELDGGEVLERRLERAQVPAFDAGRAGDDERPRALGEVGVEHDIRDAAEVIAMEMADQDGVDGV